MRIWQRGQAVWAAQRGFLFPWVPVCLGLGIGAYFTLGSEPGAMSYALLGLVVLAAGGLAWWLGRRHPGLAPFALAGALMAFGLCLAGARAHQVAGPVIGWRYYGPIEGRVVGIDRSASDKIRLTLDRVVLERVAPNRTPRRVRMALHGDQSHLAPRPGQVIIATGHLSPPGGPVEPGGFDFQRHSWFQGLGAVGYTRSPALVLKPPEGGLWLFRARMALSARVQAALPGEVGAFAAAVMTGDRSAMGRETMQALRVSNLAHLLAISGLHMGLLAGFVFAALRMGLALLPGAALRLPAKKMAAVGALGAAAGYLALSGGNVATQRAFVMVAVMLVAVLLDRRALSLRAVAVAAIIVLLLRPEALLGPGFQMSFAATTALVAVFGWIRDGDLRGRMAIGPPWLRRAAAPVLAVVISSGVAGLATAPVGAAHFNQIAHYGLPANLVSVPLMGVLVIPAAVLAVLLMPLGLEALALKPMGWGLHWILSVAHGVAGMEGARGAVVSPPPMVLPMLALGALVLVLWQGRLRMAGLVPMLLAFAAWQGAERPHALIAEDGGLIGVMTGEGRALSQARGAGFAAAIWLENDGDMAAQMQAAARWSAAPGDAPGLAGHRLVHIRGKRAAAAATCATGDLLVLNVEAPPGLAAAPGCLLFDPARLRGSGAVALYDRGKGIEIVQARDVAGRRLWNTRGLQGPGRGSGRKGAKPATGSGAGFVAKLLPPD